MTYQQFYNHTSEHPQTAVAQARSAQWAAARAALQRGAPPPHNVWISDVLLVVAVTLTGALLVAIAAVVALRREGWGHRVKSARTINT